MFSILPYRSLSRQLFPFENALNDFGKGFAVELRQDENNYYLNAELPGVNEKDISLEVVEDRLIIKAKFENEKKEEKDNYFYSERRCGEFERQFNIQNINQENISASLENGVLKLTLPKKEKENKTRQIPIRLPGKEE